MLMLQKTATSNEQTTIPTSVMRSGSPSFTARKKFFISSERINAAGLIYHKRYVGAEMIVSSKQYL